MRQQIWETFQYSKDLSKREGSSKTIFKIYFEINRYRYYLIDLT